VPRTTETHGRTGRPPLTSRAQILAAARQLIDRDGWEKLTVRRLAAEIGVGATTLYHHVRDKDDLLVLLLNDYTAQLERPPLPDDPRDRIVAAATAVHDALTAWPLAPEVITTESFFGRLGESALWFAEAIVAGAIDHGCTPAQAVHVFRSIWSYTAGEILVRAHSARHRAGDERDTTLGNVDAAALPHLGALRDTWTELTARDTYPQGLRAFVDGLLTHAAAGTP
jgi:AcrR family transcriptional regulator